LAEASVHEILRTVWTGATAWVVGRYVLMPDHLHLFCAPNEAWEGEAPAEPLAPHGSPGGSPSPSLDAWVRYWKSIFTKLHSNPAHKWQAGYWDTRLRQDESYEAKWDYVRQNPVRAHLVSDPVEWPYQGELHALYW